MPIPAQETVVYDVHDCKVYPILTDPTTGPPTYDAGIDVPGIAEISMEPNFVTQELKGDAKVIAKKGKVDKFNFSATYGRLSLAVLEVLFGGSVTDGTDDSTWKMPGVNALQYFGAAFQIADTEIGDVHVYVYKAQVTGGSLISQSTDEFGQPSVDFEAIPAADDTYFVDIKFNDATTDLPANLTS